MTTSAGTTSESTFRIALNVSCFQSDQNFGCTIAIHTSLVWLLMLLLILPKFVCLNECHQLNKMSAIGHLFH